MLNHYRHVEIDENNFSLANQFVLNTTRPITNPCISVADLKFLTIQENAGDPSIRSA